MFEIGQKAPEFTLYNQDGADVSLTDAAGKWLVLYFYPKALTPGCATQACELRDSMAELKAQGIEVWGISAHPAPLLKKFVEAEKLNFTLLGNDDKEMIKAYGAWQEKSMYGKKYMGIGRMTYIINPKGEVAAVWPKVAPKKHLPELRKWFKENLS